MADTLTSNVIVDGKWYGPDYPQNGAPPTGKITNEAAYAEPTTGYADNRFTAADFATDDPPNLRGRDVVAGASEPVPDGNVDDVLNWVGDDKVKAQRALETEQAKSSPRSTLVEALEDLLTK